LKAAEDIATEFTPNISLVTADLSDVSALETAARELFDSHGFLNDEGVEEIIFINNAGSLGDLAPIGSDSISISSISEAINLNVTSFSYLTSEFIKR
jgi:short-subunit dehydrogenase